MRCLSARAPRAERKDEKEWRERAGISMQRKGTTTLEGEKSTKKKMLKMTKRSRYVIENKEK
jgi:hypothetical protein